MAPTSSRLTSTANRIGAIFESPASPHETRGAGVVRPVVFGATDGLVCNLSLIMGVAGAAGEDPHSIVIAGVAGLLAGGFSMAVGEYVSVRSQRELLAYQPLHEPTRSVSIVAASRRRRAIRGSRLP